MTNYKQLFEQNKQNMTIQQLIKLYENTSRIAEIYDVVNVEKYAYFIDLTIQIHDYMTERMNANGTKFMLIEK